MAPTKIERLQELLNTVDVYDLKNTTYKERFFENPDYITFFEIAPGSFCSTYSDSKLASLGVRTVFHGSTRDGKEIILQCVNTSEDDSKWNEWFYFDIVMHCDGMSAKVARVAKSMTKVCDTNYFSFTFPNGAGDGLGEYGDNDRLGDTIHSDDPKIDQTVAYFVAKWWDALYQCFKRQVRRQRRLNTC